MASCPICGRPAAPRAHNPSAPFCSARCKGIDLGQWLDEKYRIPAAPGPPSGMADEETEGAAAALDVFSDPSDSS